MRWISRLSITSDRRKSTSSSEDCSSSSSSDYMRASSQTSHVRDISIVGSSLPLRASKSQVSLIGSLGSLNIPLLGYSLLEVSTSWRMTWILELTSSGSWSSLIKSRWVSGDLRLLLNLSLSLNLILRLLLSLVFPRLGLSRFVRRSRIIIVISPSLALSKFGAS